MESDMSGYVVHKFGGTSVGSVDAIRRVKEIVEAAAANGDKIAVVVSAMGGKPKVTDILISLVTLALKSDESGYEAALTNLRSRHFDVIEELVRESAWAELKSTIERDLDDLRHILKAVSVLKLAEERIMEIVSGHGELWTAQILAAVLSTGGTPYKFLDARKVILVDNQDNQTFDLMWEESGKRIDAFMKDDDAAMKALAAAPVRQRSASTSDLAAPATVAEPSRNGWNVNHLVMTGFICSTKDGVMTTLKRDGSDYSATILGKLLAAESVTIWTDVSGVLSADPRAVPAAKQVKQMSYNEAMELAYFGAKVVHPKTMGPVLLSKTPVYIRNTFDAEHPGTRIGVVDPPAASQNAANLSQHTDFTKPLVFPDGGSIVRGLSSVDNLALFNLEGCGLKGVPGTATRLFAALNKVSVNVIFIAQASSEHSICFAIPAKEAEVAQDSIEDAFYRELHCQMVQPISFIAPVSVIAAVGDNMNNFVGVAGRFFGALGQSGVNVLAISQGSSQRNISTVVSQSEAPKALQALHTALC
jgi:aspartokinase/homoserine dehydrogenase 1